MHASSFENMQKCYDRYVRSTFIKSIEESVVIDIGASDVNGSYRRIFSEAKIRYLGVDFEAGAGVDVVMTDPYRIPFPDNYADLVLSGQMLEHSEFFWLIFADMLRILKPSGYLFLIAPSSGPIHRYPVDCYRFYPDAYRALAKLTQCQLITVWHDDRGPWKDVVGVFRRGDAPPVLTVAEQPPDFVNVASLCNNPPMPVTGLAPQFDNPPECERTTGVRDYHDMLREIHERLSPRFYLEIGIRNGHSLIHAHCRAVGVDPAPNPIVPLSADVVILRKTSDRFFEENAPKALAEGVDLAFIDGMHWFEFALRDFLNTERHAHPTTLVVFDDILPNHSLQAARQRQTRVWTGDVWKIAPCLRMIRPDLVLLPIDTSPTGLLIVAGLQRENRELCENYNFAVRHYSLEIGEQVPEEITSRREVLTPYDPRIAQLLDLLRTSRSNGEPATTVRQRICAWRSAAQL